MMKLQGLLPITFRGVQYNIPVCVWIPQQYPNASPIPYVQPTPEMDVVQGHQHVGQDGMCYFPYCNQWTVHSNASGLLDVMVQAFSNHPPVTAKAPPVRQAASFPAPAPGPTPVQHGMGSGGMGGGAISAEAQARIERLKRRIAGDQANIDLLESMGEDTQVLKAGLQKLKQDLEQEEHRVHRERGSQAYQAPVVGMPTGDLAGGPPAYQAPAASPPHYQAPVASPPQYPAAGGGGGPPAYQYQAPMVPVPAPSPVPVARAPSPAPALSGRDETIWMLGVEMLSRSGSSGLSAEMLSSRLETICGVRVTPEDLVRVGVVGACSSASD
eukprot:COSAG02_NODE_1299_length_13382_cov_14.723858_3_plen_327_part_00